jgi:predicted PurR-regulated permease PerM
MNDPATATAAAAAAASAPPADPSTTAAAGGGWRAEVAFLRRVLIVAAVVALLLLLWQVRFALLLVFGAVVVAVALLAAAEPLEDRLGLPRAWSLAAVGGATGIALVLAALLVGGEVQAQAGQLAARLPEAVRAFEQRFGVDLPAVGEAARAAAAPRRDAAAAGYAAGWPADGGLGGSWVGEVARRFAAAGPALLNALSAVALAVVGGFFLAADPDVYVRGAVKLVPHRQHARAEDALRASGRALRLWLRAQLAAMALVGALTGLGAWAIGLPAPLALGLFAALAEFVPLVGPVAAAVPALLLALGQGAVRRCCGPVRSTSRSSSSNRTC